MGKFIEWCNTNSGFFSFVTSVIAIFISIRAIRSQKKGFVFEQRLELYCKTESVYEKCSRILEICPGRELHNQKNLIVSLLLDFDSEEYTIAHKTAEIDRELLKIDEHTQEAQKKEDEKLSLANRYAEIYISKLDHEKPFIEPLRLFYGQGISGIVEKMFKLYDTIILGVIYSEQAEIDKWLQDLKASIELMDKKHILAKMKKKLPL